MELVEADLSDETLIIKAIEESSYVVDATSPVHSDFEDSAPITTAVAGTKPATKACKYDKVPKVDTIYSLDVEDTNSVDKAENCTFNDSRWSNPHCYQGIDLFI